MRAYILCILLILSLHCVSAQVLNEISISVGEDGYTWIEESLTFEDEGEKAIYEIPYYVEDVQLTDEEGRLDFNITDYGSFKELKIYFRDYLEQNQREVVYVKYGTHHVTKKEEGIWSLNFSRQVTPRQTIVKLAFPSGVKLLSIVPEKILRTPVENGIWLYPQDEYFRFQSVYQYQVVMPDTPTTTVPINQTGSPILGERVTIGILIVLFALGIFVLALFLYRSKPEIFGKKAKNGSLTVNVAEDIVTEPDILDGKVSYDVGSSSMPENKVLKESIVKMLDDNELTIVKLLENSEDDEVTQAHIHKTTGIPKASLSDILKRIEKRNIIERRVSGRVKWIKLKKWVLE